MTYTQSVVGRPTLKSSKPMQKMKMKCTESVHRTIMSYTARSVLGCFRWLIFFPASCR